MDWTQERRRPFDIPMPGLFLAPQVAEVVAVNDPLRLGRVQVRLLENVGRDAKRALARRADELTAWLDGVRVSARFPSPLSKRQ